MLLFAARLTVQPQLMAIPLIDAVPPFNSQEQGKSQRPKTPFQLKPGAGEIGTPLRLAIRLEI
jgi:hypothetical protein